MGVGGRLKEITISIDGFHNCEFAFFTNIFHFRSLLPGTSAAAAAAEHQSQPWRVTRRHYNNKRAIAAGQEEASHRGPSTLTPRGDIGPSRVVLNATLQLNADDNSEEQIIRIRDKEEAGTAAQVGQAAMSSSSSSSSSRSTLLDNEHQAMSGSDNGPATVNLHGSDTIVNISSQVGVISGTTTTTTTTTTSLPLTSKSSPSLVKSPSTSPSSPRHPQKGVKGAGGEPHHHLSSFHSQSHWDGPDEEGDDDDQDEEEDEEAAVAIKADVTTTVSNAHKNGVAARDNDTEGDQQQQQKKKKQQPANSVINANYTDGNGAQAAPSLGRQVPSVVEKVVPHHPHDNVMNIERAIGENGEQMIIIAGEEDDDEVVNVHKNHFVEEASLMASQHKSDPTDDDSQADGGGGVVDEPIALPLRPIIRDPFDEMDDEAHHGEMTIVYAELRSEVTINCEVDMDIALNTWFHDGQVSEG